jgi:hypothetical protein
VKRKKFVSIHDSLNKKHMDYKNLDVWKTSWDVVESIYRLARFFFNLDYEIFIGHYTIHTEETVCFAKPRY